MKQKKTYNPYLEITQSIIERLRQGTIPWRESFAGADFGLPKNYFSGHQYRGVNLLLLGMLPYEHPFYLSFLQCQQLGGRIRKGAKSQRVYFSSFLYFDGQGKKLTEQQFQQLENTGVEGLQKRFFLRYFNLFNIEFVEGVDWELPERPSFVHSPDEHCEALIERLQPALVLQHQHRTKAFYHPGKDVVNVPELQYFYSPHQYYATLFHELGHWTGHPRRLNRDFSAFGSQTYSKEELVAELSACFLCAERGILNEPLKDNSAAYIQSWMKVLQNEERLVYQAAQQAQKALQFILDFQPSNVQKKALAA